MRTAILALCLLATGVLAEARASAAAPPLPRHGLLGAVLAADGGAVTVRAVIPGGAADAAHLQPGDVIRAIAGAPVRDVAGVVQTVRRTVPGTMIPIVLVRNGLERQLTITVGAPPDEHDPAVHTVYDAVVVQGTPRRTIVDVPNGARGRRPGVLLIGGIGCYSVDVAADPNDGYLRIARDLARAGFVTMRLEKSGVGDSAGPPCADVDFHDESASYAVALEALRRDPHVDPSRVYLLGHSIGTLIAPRLALEQRAAGVVVAEAVGRDWFEYELQNLRRQLELGGDPPEAVDAKLAAKERCMHRLLIAREPEPQIERDETDCSEPNGIYPVGAAYMQQVAALNVIEPWTRIDVPVLVVYGTSDYVVARDDHVRIVDVVNRKHPGLATLRAIAGMDHVLHAAPTAEAAYANAASGTAEPYQTAFSDAVVAWMCAREACTKR